MTLQDILDPLMDASFKGFPHGSAPLRRSAIGQQNWNVLRGDLPLPLAVIRRDALNHNLQWMQRFAQDRGLGLAPHGKTSMSPQLFQRQLAAGAWGMTFANVTQARSGIAAGAGNILIANQVFAPIDLQAIADLKRSHAGLRFVFLVDSLEQLVLIEAWHSASIGVAPFEVLLEIGVMGGRTGCRSHAQALTLAQRLHTSTAVHLVGIECYEGLAATGNSVADAAYVVSLMQNLTAIAKACDTQALFDHPEVLITAGGSAVFDLVASHLKPALSRPVRGLLRSGCYVTHDQGNYKRMMSAVASRLGDPANGLGCGTGLHAALEVWAAVQSRPEPGLAILNAGKRDISHDLDMPVALSLCKRGTLALQPAPSDLKITALNDQHAYLRWSEPANEALQVGDLVCLGISHPCTTYDKWRWMPLVDENYTVCDAIVTCF
jgi:D-serine dehydratase